MDVFNRTRFQSDTIRNGHIKGLDRTVLNEYELERTHDRLESDTNPLEHYEHMTTLEFPRSTVGPLVVSTPPSFVIFTYARSYVLLCVLRPY